MPPKSSTKKNTTASWYHCEACGVHITSKARDSHEKYCPIDDQKVNDGMHILEYIYSGVFYTIDVQPRKFEIEELKELPAKFLNSLIFISEGAIRLAGYSIGEKILVQTIKGNVPVVRSIWPIPEKFLTTVFVMEEDYIKNFEQYKDITLRIQKLPNGSINSAKEVHLKLQKEQQDDILTIAQLKEAGNLLKMEMKDLIYTRGSRLIFNFFNRKLILDVKDWNAASKSISDAAETEENILEALGNLNLKENIVKNSNYKFFKVIGNTTVRIEYEKSTEIVEEAVEGISKHSITKADIGGLDEQWRLIENTMKLAMGFKRAPKGIKVSRGILIFGCSGCGKSLLCEALSTVAQQTSPLTQILSINASEIFSKFLGETEKNLMCHFDKAYAHYPQPTLIIVEDVHNLCPKEDTNDISKRVCVAFASMLDTLSNRTEGQRTFLLASTSEIESVSPSIRRCGRLDTEVEISAPSPKERAEILRCVLRNVTHDLTTEQIDEIAMVTHGFVGADLVNLVSNAALATQQANRSSTNVSDVLNALTHVKPSAMREVLIENPNVHWSDIGGQSDLKLQLKQAIEWPLLYPEKFARLGIKPPRGILMYGPPGCSKTMIAKALATESQLNFLSIKGPELFSMWVGESERAVRDVFRKARQVAPAIVFFDEIDAIGGERAENSGNGGGSSVQERVLTQLLTELDGVEALQNVTIVAATNRPDKIDKALLRPGRIDRIVYVGLPEADARREIFRIKLNGMPLADDIDLERLIQSTNGYTGAEIQAVCHEAALKTLEESLEAEHITWNHFDYALSAVQPRTSPELLQLYEDYAARK